MDRLEFLVRRFRQIAPQPLTDWDPVRARHLHCWLKDDVGPALQEYAKRPRFRAQAAWPIHTLRPGAGTAERALVESVDAALVAQSQALSRFAQRSKVRKLLEAAAIEDVVTEEEVLLGAGAPQVTRRVHAPFDRLALSLGQLERMAGRFWQDLVCLEDYFEPAGGWMAGEHSGPQAGEFIVALNPELHPGGDFISRCLCRRAEVLWGTLVDFRSLCDKAFRMPGAQPPKEWKEVGRCPENLRPLVERLRHACLQGDQQPLRDACILLTQVLTALEPGADLDWLGLPEIVLRRGAAGTGHRLRSCHGELLERLAASLSELRELYADADERQSAIEEAITTGGLVLVESPQHVYWEGKLLRVTWARYPAIWRFFKALVKKGRRGAVAEERDVYVGSPTRSAVGTLFYRLKGLIPASLWKHIAPSRDPRGYRLTLERQQIHLFSTLGDGASVAENEREASGIGRETRR